MKIIYISALSSEKLIDDIFTKTSLNPGFAIQKFSRLIVQGLAANNQNVTALSNPPITREYNSNVLVKYGAEEEKSIKYKYIPFININGLKHICVFVYTFFYIFFWGLKSRKTKRILCDSLSVSATLGALLASKINRVKSCAIITDIYGLMIGNEERSKFMRTMASALCRWYNTKFNYYVLLTEQMNPLVNPNMKPYIVMEGLSAMPESDFACINKDTTNTKILLYAGGIEEKYGLKMLVDAFNLLDENDVQLHIYGNGSYVEQLKLECLRNPKIKYKGVRSNSEIMENERRATLLVNPRFSTEEFAKYSFPSKNMEYMFSGTPLLTTNLPGMPAEYHDYVYIFDEESVEGYFRKMSEVLSQDKSELEKFGETARKFVLEQKNYIKQTERIINLLR